MASVEEVHGESEVVENEDATIRVSVRFFALYRERAGTARRDVQLPAGSTVADLLEVLTRDHPDLPEETTVAVNQEYAAKNAPLEDGDEAALIPPVAGG